MQHIDFSTLKPRICVIPDDLLGSTRKTVLVLEDDPAFAEMMRDALEIDGYRVTTVSTGMEGVRQILAADFDDVVCDMVMPNFPGDMFYKAVQQSRPPLCNRFIFSPVIRGIRKLSSSTNSRGVRSFSSRLKCADC